MEWCVKKKRIQIRLSSLIYYTHVWTWSHSNEYMRIYETLKQSSILHMTSFPLNLTVLKIEQLKQHCHLWTENKTSAGVPSQIPAGGRDGPFSSALCNGVAMVEVVVGLWRIWKWQRANWWWWKPGKPLIRFRIESFIIRHPADVLT